MKSYNNKNWKAFRDEVIRLDGGACAVCGRTLADGVILQVHHKQYLQGFKPWEYPSELCETLCKGCHASEHGKIPPKFGWEHIGYDDLGDLTGTCECCGNNIRYVFLVQHEKWGAMEVGEVCCDNLTSTQAASGLMESRRRYARRLKTFIGSIRWKIAASGIHHLVQDKVHIEIVPQNNEFKLRVNNKMGKMMFKTILDAKIKSFELIESGELGDYVKRQNQKYRDYIDKSRFY
ncbi:hypothetical protein MTYP_03278 [Methylophilaceae bacterium]|nr:hypothetical protein MTYP_03278 [Methylophilaceae bacterium]